MTSDIEFIIQQKLILIRHVLYLDNDWILLRTNCFSFCFPLDYYCDWHYLYTVITGHIEGTPTQVTSKPGYYMYNCGRIQEKPLHFEDCSLSCHNRGNWEPSQLVVGSLNRTHQPTLTTIITYGIQHERKIIITNALKNHLKRWHGTHHGTVGMSIQLQILDPFHSPDQNVPIQLSLSPGSLCVCSSVLTNPQRLDSTRLTTLLLLSFPSSHPGCR